MLRLVTLGGLALLDSAGTPVPTSRLRLALLALLAVAGPRGLTRDKVLAYLWPDSAPDAARHALDQLLYALRRQSPQTLVTGGDPLRLDAAVITSDLSEFDRAVSGRDWETAVRLYHGPLLDGFFAGTGAEFEEWAEDERALRAREYARALYEMAKEAGSRGRHTVEIDCWRKLAAADPLSERSAGGLVRALAAAGDWPAALEHSRAFDAAVRRDLGADHASLTAQVERLRAERAATGSPAVSEGERYTIVREIGRGSMAIVFLARDGKLQRDVALKLLRPELASSTAQDRFEREIAILAALHHPNILPIHDCGVLVSGGRRRQGPYFVMPLVRGDSLRARLATELQLPLEAAVRIAEEVADALSYAHARRIIHRDIKPENILLESGHALLADFGVAYAVDLASGQALSLSGIRLGAPGYMSPEQAAGDSRGDPRSDLYSLACVVYEMLAGEPPFTGATAQALAARHAADPVPPLRTVRPDIPESVEAALLRALAKKPEDRFASAVEFAAALRPGA